MTETEKKALALVERRYLLVKRGLYYAPDRQGYTGLKAKAGRYREVDALGLDGVAAIHEDEAQDFAPACWEETKLAHLNGIIETQAREIERLRGTLERIGIYGCGMLNQPAAMNGPEEVWLKQRIFETERAARAALAGDSHDQ